MATTDISARSQPVRERIDLTPLYGAWELTAWRRVASDGTMTHPFTDLAVGHLTYERTDRVAVLLMHPGWPAGDHPRGFHAYGGRFFVDGDTICHIVELADQAELVGQTLVRAATLEEGGLRLEAPATDDRTARHILEWRRVP